jgi:hypothetical protein
MRAYELLNEQQQLDLNILKKVKAECNKIARSIKTIRIINRTASTVAGEDGALPDIEIIRRVTYDVVQETAKRMGPLINPSQQLTEDPASSKKEHYKVLNDRADKINQYILIADAFEIILPLITQLNYNNQIIKDIKLALKSINREALIKLSRRYADLV